MRYWIGTARAGALVALSIGCGGDSVTAPTHPVALDVVSGDKQTAPANTQLPKPLIVRVTDANGQPVQGQIVNFRVTVGGGSMFAGAGSTNSQGIVQDRWTLGPAGPQTAEARAVDNTTGAAIVFATFTATGIDTTTPPPPPPPSFGSFSVVSGANQRAMVGTHLPAPVVFLVLDQTGQPLAGFIFTLRSLHCDPLNGGCPSTAGDDQLTNPTLTTGTDGTAAFIGWTFSDVAGPKCLGFYPGTQPPRSESDVGLLAVCAAALPGPLARLVLLGASPISGNASIFDVLVQAEDQFGNQIDGVTVTFTPSPGGSVSPASDQTHTIPSTPYVAANTTWGLAPGSNTLTVTAGNLSLVIND
jgi:hypothetical protein